MSNLSGAEICCRKPSLLTAASGAEQALALTASLSRQAESLLIGFLNPLASGRCKWIMEVCLSGYLFTSLSE